MLLYIHVPFCRQKCRYCAFASGPFSREAVRMYVDLLLQELKIGSEHWSHPVLETIYFGGGTPSLLEARDVERILSTIAAGCHLLPDAEITLEANPESANTSNYLKALYHLGINRLSLGVQSLEARQLALLGRLHSPHEALQTLDKARQAGFSNIGLDLIWGIPGQTLAQWLNQLQTLVRLRPDHLSCYGLTVEPGTPLHKERTTRSLTLPDEEALASMFLEGSALLRDQGYEQYEISNFCLPGKHSRHNTGYWKGSDYLGVGPAAVSTVAGKRWEHPCTLTSYARLLKHQNLYTRGEVINEPTRTNEQIMLALRTHKGLDLNLLRQRPGHDSRHLETLTTSLCHNGLAVLEDTTIRLTPEGMLVSDSIIPEFFVQEPPASFLVPDACTTSSSLPTSS